MSDIDSSSLLDEWRWVDRTRLKSRGRLLATTLVPLLVVLEAAVRVVGGSLLWLLTPLRSGSSSTTGTTSEPKQRTGDRGQHRPRRAKLDDRVAAYLDGGEARIVLHDFAWSSHRGTRELVLSDGRASWDGVYGGDRISVPLRPIEVVIARRLDQDECRRRGLADGHLRCEFFRDARKSEVITSPADLAVMAVLGGASCPAGLAERYHR